MQKNSTCSNSSKRKQNPRAIDDDRDETRHLLCAGQRGGDGERSSVPTTKKGMTEVWLPATVSHRYRSRDAFAMGEPAVEQPGA